MPIERLSLKLPPGTKARIDRLRLDRETTTAVLLRALDALETAPDVPAAEPVTARMDAIERRLDALETSNRRPRKTASDVPVQPERGERDALERPQGVMGYPIDVKRRAVEMKQQGFSHRQIVAWIESETGRAPNLDGMSSQLKKWAEKLK